MGSILIGIDEVGMGAIAGPILAAAVCIEDGVIDGVRDSKVVAEKQRYALGAEIIRKAEFSVVALRGAAAINTNGVKLCWREIILEVAEAAARARPGMEILIDGAEDKEVTSVARKMGFTVRFVVHGDAEVYQIGAASLLAKSTRDKIMIELDTDFPLYGFRNHKGYPTSLHIQALRDHGVLPFIYRVSAANHALSREGTHNFCDHEVAEYSPSEAKGYTDLALSLAPMLTDLDAIFVADMGRKLSMGADLTPRQRWYLRRVAENASKKYRTVGEPWVS